MATHINAFAQDVEDKRKEMVAAEGAYNDAIAALKAHPDYEEPKDESEGKAPLGAGSGDESSEEEGSDEE